MFIAAIAREYLRGAAGQKGSVVLPLEIPEAVGRLGNPGTLVELHWEIGQNGSLEVRPWIDGVPADVNYDRTRLSG
jgi:hypothetical protein